MIGTTLAHYRITAKLGAGGMGEVYLAEDTKLGREVALKVLSEDFARDRERLSRFQREARAVAALNHPNIVTIHSVEEEEGVHFITMECVAGKSLDELIPRQGLGAEKLLDFGVQLAEALSIAHAAGVTHRDLKPANVMVTANGRVKILDFGLAKLKPSKVATEELTNLPTLTMTRAGVVMGTAPYMSPEQIEAQVVDHRTDIFSLGVLLYEMATGQRPFQGVSSAAVVSSILRDTPSAVTELKPDLPKQLGRIIRHCLEKDPERRFQSAKDIRNELQDLRRELDTSQMGAASSMTGASAESRSKWRWLVAAGIGAALLVALLVGVNFGKRGQGPSEAGSRPQISSLAVLPFQNLMNDPEQDYFVDGMHEALITNLSKISALRVISRTSAMRYKGSDKRLPQIASELDVDALVEGSVLRADDQVRITAQLIHGASDEHLWAESYDRRLEKVLALLSEVAQIIAAEIEVTLTPQETRRVSEVEQVDPEALEAYLRGRAAFGEFTGAGFRTALEFYRQAIEIEPNYALAHASLASAHLLLGGFGIAPQDESAEKARAAAQRALELNENLDDGYAVLGWVQLYFDWDWAGALREFERALEINPNHGYANHGYADYLTAMGQPDEAVAYVQRGRQSDPLSPSTNTPVAGHLYLARRYDEAIDECRALLGLDPKYPGARGFLASALWAKGLHEQSLEVYRELWQTDSDLVTILNSGYETLGPNGALRAVAHELARRAATDPSRPLGIANLYGLAGEIDLTFEWLERAFEERVPQLILVPSDPAFDAIRTDPRFQELLQRMDLPVEQLGRIHYDRPHPRSLLHYCQARRRWNGRGLPGDRHQARAQGGD